MNTKILVLIATVLWGVWAFAARKAVASMPPLSSSIVSCACSVITVPLYLLIAKVNGIQMGWNATGVSWTILGALASSFGAVAVLYAVKSGEGSTVIALTAAYPAIAFLLGLMFLGDKMTVSGLAGLICVSVGAVLLSR